MHHFVSFPWCSVNGDHLQSEDDDADVVVGLYGLQELVGSLKMWLGPG